MRTGARMFESRRAARPPVRGTGRSPSAHSAVRTDFERLSSRGARRRVCDEVGQPAHAYGYSVGCQLLTPTGSDALLDADPDLGAALDGAEFAAARDQVRVALLHLEEGKIRGKWGAGSPQLAGLLLVEGALLREVRTARRVTAELIGPGDLIRPFEEDGEEDVPVRAEIIWRTVLPTTLA